jgi:hypothetical protein
MSTLTWDNVGDHLYQFGIDRGVLYLDDGNAVAWNGLRGMDEGSDAEKKAFYLDGVKFLETVTPGDFQGTLKAYTYPDEFDELTGIKEDAAGLFFHEQPTKPFSLSYRTRIANELDENLGYKIHILYNLRALPESHTYQTLEEQSSANEFSWSLSGVPPKITGYRPTVHVSIDSTKTPEDRLAALEEVLYGTDTTDPRLPPISEIRAYFSDYGDFVVTDNGDGSWDGYDPTDDIIYITSDDGNEFTIDHADVNYLDVDTFQITTSDAPLP